MIVLVYAIRRLPTLSEEDFQEYWRDQHGPLVASFSTTLGIRRYVQNHSILDHPVNCAVRDKNDGYLPLDGHEFYWFENHDVLAKALAAPAGKKATEKLIADEQKFIDFSRSTMFVGIEQIQVKGGDLEFTGALPENLLANEKNQIIKGTCILYRNADTFKTRAEYLTWLRGTQGPQVRNYADSIRVLRYAQIHNIDDPLTDELRSARGKMEETPDSSTNIWFHKLHQEQASITPEGKQAWELIRIDEANELDMTRPTFGLQWSKEFSFVDRMFEFTPRERKILKEKGLIGITNK